MGDVTLRPATPKDIDAVRELLKVSDLPLHGVDHNFGERFAVAEQGGKVVGTQAVEVYGPYGMIRSAAVAPDRRGTGLGSELTRDRIRWSKDRGLTTLYLFTVSARPFFERHGFTVVPRETAPPEIKASEEYRSVCHDSGIFMQLPL